MGQPHKHADIIKAWADGAEIQYSNHPTDVWKDIAAPTWQADCRYRIKPTVLKGWINIYPTELGYPFVLSGASYSTKTEASNNRKKGSIATIYVEFEKGDGLE